MDRGRKALPVQNKACHQRYVQRCQERHRQKLRDMKCSIDNKPPREGSHLKTKAKKNFLIDERMGQIETENRILLQKMTNIMRTKGSIDNKNESIRYARSLSKEHRKRELQKIMKQNHKILQRIQNARPTYNHQVWAEEAKNNDKILANISEFKTKRAKNSFRRMKLRSDDEDFLLDYDAIKTSAAGAGGDVGRRLKYSKKSKSNKSLVHKTDFKSGNKSQKSSRKSSEGSLLSAKSSSRKVTSIPWSAPSRQPSTENGSSNINPSKSESPSSKELNDISSAPTIFPSSLAEKMPVSSHSLPSFEPSTTPSESSYKLPIQNIRVKIQIQRSSWTRTLLEYSKENLHFTMVRYISSILNTTYSNRFLEIVLLMEEISSEEEFIEIQVSGITLFRGEPPTTTSTLTELIRASLEDDSFQNELLTSSTDDTMETVTNIEATLGHKNDEVNSNESRSDLFAPQIYTILFSCAGIAAFMLFRMHQQTTRRRLEDDTSTCTPPERIHSSLSMGHSLDSVTCSSMKNNSNAAPAVIGGKPAAGAEEDVSYVSAFDNVCFQNVLGVHSESIPEGRCDDSFYIVWENAIATPKLSNFSKKNKREMKNESEQTHISI